MIIIEACFVDILFAVILMIGSCDDDYDAGDDDDCNQLNNPV
jgi:hypothetical protein